METVDAISLLLDTLPKEQKVLTSREDWDALVDSVEQRLSFGELKAAQMKHRFTEGLYIRECILDEGDLITTIPQKYDYPFFLHEGALSIRAMGGMRTIEAPFLEIVKPDNRRIMYAFSRVRMISIHPNPMNLGPDSVTEIMEPLYIKRDNPLLDFDTFRIVQSKVHEMNAN